ncbi:MAG TPA: family 16 glycoside hydrolase, partial [Pirellulales bacterium]|nr:family 16 glycoside hydrolase [Pirellulales bacterium]
MKRHTILASLIAVVCLSPELVPCARGDEALTGVALFDRQSLAGWQYGAEAPQGWTMTDGVLRGEEGATPLLSGWTWGDFELSFRFSAPDGSRLQLLLPEAPAGAAGLTLSLAEGATAGELRQGDRQLAAGGMLEIAKDGWHEARVRRSGHSFSLEIDGRRLYEIQLSEKARYGLGLSVE